MRYQRGKCFPDHVKLADGVELSVAWSYFTILSEIPSSSRSAQTESIHQIITRDHTREIQAKIDINQALTLGLAVFAQFTHIHSVLPFHRLTCLAVRPKAWPVILYGRIVAHDRLT
ncbi:hypothetical protein D3C87_1245220 [compost metagenome]